MEISGNFTRAVLSRILGMWISKIFSLDKIFWFVSCSFIKYMALLSYQSSQISFFSLYLTTFPFVLFNYSFLVCLFVANSSSCFSWGAGRIFRWGSGPPGTEITISVKAWILKQPLECSQTYIPANFVPLAGCQTEQGSYLDISFADPCTPLIWPIWLSFIRQKKM